MLFHFGVNIFLSALFFLLASCSQAGLIPDEISTTASIGQNQSALIEINGMVGIGEPVTNADITAIDVTLPNAPQIIGDSASDALGRFDLTELYLSDDDSVMLIATGGKYIDPVTFKSVPMNSDALMGVWKVRNLSLLESVSITPMTTLQTAFYDCLIGTPGLAADPVDYSHAIFKSAFGVNLNANIFLEGGTSSSAETTAHSLYNIAFSAMADRTKATSAIHIITAFSDSLEENCDLVGTANKISGAYAFHPESFRKDYLDALGNLPFMPAFSELAGNFDTTGLIEAIRENTNILFEFSSYDL